MNQSIFRFNFFLEKDKNFKDLSNKCFLFLLSEIKYKFLKYGFKSLEIKLNFFQLHHFLLKDYIKQYQSDLISLFSNNSQKLSVYCLNLSQ